MSEQQTETALPQGVQELIERHVDAAFCPNCGGTGMVFDAEWIEDNCPACERPAKVTREQFALALQSVAVRALEQERAQAPAVDWQQPADRDDIHTGDDALLDALTGARTALESIDNDPDVDVAEAVADALEELTTADKIRVAELRPLPGSPVHRSASPAAAGVREPAGRTSERQHTGEADERI